MTLEEVLAELKALIQKAETEDRPLTDAEAQRAEELETELKRYERTLDIKTRAEDYSKVRNEVPRTAKAAVVNEPDPLERSFIDLLRTGYSDGALERAQGTGTTAGGYLVPTTLRDKLVERVVAFGGVAAEVETINTTSGESMTWPTNDDTANSGVIAAENTAPGSGGADFVFGQGSLGVYKYTVPGVSQLPLRVSVELLQDSAFDVESFVGRKLSERIARAQAAHWVNGLGSGSSQPLGLANKSGGPSYNGATGAAPTYANLVAAKHSLDPAYRTTAVWAFNDDTLALIEGLVDGNGRPLLNESTDSISGDVKMTLLGHRVVVDQAFQDFTDDTTNTWGVFGDLRQAYVIRRVQDVTLIVDPYTRSNEGQVQYTMWVRAGGTVQDVYAYSTLKNAEDA